MTTTPTPDEPDVSAAGAQANDADRMRALIEALSAYMEYYHGGGVSLVSFDGENLRVKMTGACQGCKLTPLTLHGWIEGTVRPFFPHLKRVEAV